MICAYCGTDLPLGAMFCGECGRPVAARTVARGRSESVASSLVTALRWPVSVAEHESENVPAPTRPPREPAAHEPAADVLVEPPRASDAVFAEPPPSALSKPETIESGQAPAEVAETADAARALAESEAHAAEAPEAELQAAAAHAQAAAEAERVAAEAVERAAAEALAAAAEAEREAAALEAATEAALVAGGKAAEAAAGVARADAVPGFEGSDVVVRDLLEPHPEENCAQCGATLAASDIFCGECGFVRKLVAPPSARPRDTAGYDPFPWGLPRAADIVPTEEAPAPPDENFDDESDMENTRIVDRSVRGDRFVLQFSTGESVSVTGTGLIGRNPVAEPGEYFDTFVTIVDPGKSVSKTHLEFGQDSGAFWVSDRFSANGTILREPDRPVRRGDAGKRYRVVRGTRVDIGEQFFIVS